MWLCHTRIVTHIDGGYKSEEVVNGNHSSEFSPHTEGEAQKHNDRLLEELDLNLHRIDKVCCLLVDKPYIGYDNIGIIFSFIENSQFMPML